jgi:LPS export ABC transporter protein LptC
VKRAPTPAIALVILLLAGCQPREPSPQAGEPPFVFRSLALRQTDPKGRPTWEISSPEARYELGRKLARARKLEGLVYEKGVPRYRVSANRAIVLNDGEVVQLEGLTRVERIDKNPVVITAQRVRWYPHKGLMQLDRQPMARQKRMQLSSREARFDFNQDKLTLDGEPVLIDQNQPRIELTLTRLHWWAKSGQLQGEGPVKGERRDAANRRQRLSSPGLSGNSLRQELVLSAPVRVVDPAEQAELIAGATRFDLERETSSSDQPFVGTRGAAILRGPSFIAFNKTTTLEMPRGCDLSQPGDRLTANRCNWNWKTNQVQAAGAVTLRRQAQGLVTRAESLDGRVADDGMVVFTRPGGSVTSTVRVPERREERGRPKRKPPIQL